MKLLVFISLPYPAHKWTLLVWVDLGVGREAVIHFDMDSGEIDFSQWSSTSQLKNSLQPACQQGYTHTHKQTTSACCPILSPTAYPTQLHLSSERRLRNRGGLNGAPEDEKKKKKKDRVKRMSDSWEGGCM